MVKKIANLVVDILYKISGDNKELFLKSLAKKQTIS